jgi:GNAT superfamily N-acetyltransferase
VYHYVDHLGSFAAWCLILKKRIQSNSCLLARYNKYWHQDQTAFAARAADLAFRCYSNIYNTELSTMSTQYRSAKPEDIAQCIDIRGKTRENAVPAARLAQLGITLQSWSEEVRSGEMCGHICEFDGQIVGYAFGATATGEVVVLALLPEYEGQGIGKELLQQTMDELKSLGHRRLFLGCSSDPQVRSHGFYRRLGWRPVGRTDKYGDEMLEYFFN